MEGSHIIIQSLNPLNRREMLINYLRAVERFRSACLRNAVPGDNLRDESLGWAALAEALFWLFTIMENTKGNPNLSVADIELLEAFESARNIAQHASWNGIATEIQHNVSGQRNSWIWGNRPKNEQLRKREATLAEAYKARLQGQEILPTLDQIAKEMWSIRGWQIARDAIEQPGYTVECDIQFDEMAVDSGEESGL